jgi:RimJ/RimL family protein N-acetyltransferase
MLQGQKVILRAIEPADLANYVVWLNDPEVLAWLGRYRPMSLPGEQAWYEAQAGRDDVLNFAIEYESRHVGGCGFLNINRASQNAEVGIFIGDKSLWDQGLGKDALRTLVRYGFDYLNFHRVYLRVFAENARAVHAYEQVGFVHEGRFRQNEWRHGQWQDTLYMSILRDEWQ